MHAQRHRYSNKKRKERKSFQFTNNEQKTGHGMRSFFILQAMPKENEIIKTKKSVNMIIVEQRLDTITEHTKKRRKKKVEEKKKKKKKKGGDTKRNILQV